MKTLYLTLFYILLPFTVFGEIHDFCGRWYPSPVGFGEIFILESERDGYYDISIDTPNGKEYAVAIFEDNTLYGSYEIERPVYGQFWVSDGPISDGKEKEIIIGHDDGYGYKSDGAVSGLLGENIDYLKTNSRKNCATIKRTYCNLIFEFKGDKMTASFQLRAEFLKNGMPMFYQESSWYDREYERINILRDDELYDYLSE